MDTLQPESPESPENPESPDRPASSESPEDPDIPESPEGPDRPERDSPASSESPEGPDFSSDSDSSESSESSASPEARDTRIASREQQSTNVREVIQVTDVATRTKVREVGVDIHFNMARTIVQGIDTKMRLRIRDTCLATAMACLEKSGGAFLPYLKVMLKGTQTLNEVETYLFTWLVADAELPPHEPTPKKQKRKHVSSSSSKQKRASQPDDAQIAERLDFSQYSEADRRFHVKEHTRKRVSMADYCKDNGLDLDEFKRWKATYRKKPGPAPGAKRKRD